MPDTYKESELRDMLLSAIQLLKKQAENIVADYWAFVEESNDGLRKDKKIGVRSKEKPICLGPRVEVRQTGGYEKYVPNWVHYPFDPRRFTSKKVAKQGKRIKPSTNNEYKISTLLKYSTGADDARIIKTEIKLTSLRERLEVYHQALVSFDRREKRIQRITENLKGEL